MSEDEKAAAFAQHVRTSADAAAAQIIAAIERRRARLVLGPDARFINLLTRFFPVSYPRFLPGLGRAGTESVV
jgi:hypothetical protein